MSVYTGITIYIGNDLYTDYVFRGVPSDNDIHKTLIYLSVTNPNEVVSAYIKVEGNGECSYFYRNGHLLNDQNAILAKLENLYNATINMKQDAIHIINNEMSFILSATEINNQIDALMENEDALIFQYSSWVDLFVALARIQINNELDL